MCQPVFLVAAFTRVDEYRELNPLGINEGLRPACVAVANCYQLGVSCFDLVNSFSEASRLLAAKYSPKVAEKRNDGLATIHDLVEFDHLIVEILDCYQSQSPPRSRWLSLKCASPST